MRVWSIFLSAALAVSLLSPAFGGSPQNLRLLADTELRDWASHPTIVDAVRAQNQQYKYLSADGIFALDRRWRSEMVSVSKPMIQALMANALSSFLTLKKRASGGLFSEIVVMDGKGLNVGLSDVVPDYWQGNNDRWRKTFLAGPGSLHIQDVIRGDGPQRFQSLVSLPVVDPVTRKAIGAVSVVVDIAKLPR